MPFEELKLDLFGGPRASVSTPALCGAYATDAVFTPWSGTGPVSGGLSRGRFRGHARVSVVLGVRAVQGFGPGFDA